MNKCSNLYPVVRRTLLQLQQSFPSRYSFLLLFLSIAFLPESPQVQTSQTQSKRSSGPGKPEHILCVTNKKTMYFNYMFT